MKEDIYNERKKQKKHREVYIVLLLLVAISIGFSYLSSQLQIFGNTTVRKQSWNVHFLAPTATSGNIPGTSTTIASRGTSALGTNPDTSTNSLVVNFTANLEYPGDYYEFTVPVTNSGTIDAMIASDGIVNEADFPSYITYSVTYGDTNSTAIAAGDGLHHGKKVPIKVRIEYSRENVTNADVNNMSEDGVTISSSYTMTFVQADGNANYKNFEVDN